MILQNVTASYSPTSRGAAPIVESVKHVCERRLARRIFHGSRVLMPLPAVFAVAHREVPGGAQRALTLTGMMDW